MQVGQLPPGPETGNFYIPICNALKEWLSRDCEVDFIQLYHPTSGWIRVKGPNNFYRVCDRLKGVVFNGRRIIYDDSNMTSAIVVKEVHNDENAVSVNGTVSSRQPAPAPFSTQSDHQPAPYPFAFSEFSSLGQQVRVPSTTWYQTTIPNLQQAPTDLEHFSQGLDSTQTQGAWYLEYPAYVSNGRFFPSAAAPTNQPSQAVSVVHRRIIIRRIEPSTSEDQIKGLIKQSLAQLTPVKAELQRIDVPRGSGSQNRGHAFATFQTTETAQSVAEFLNGKTWNSRRLEARLTTEGKPHVSNAGFEFDFATEEMLQREAKDTRTVACASPLGIYQSPF
ncbi:unnamed protein product [Colletotrichum noveboracense]|uniref:RRM domain-containing protein n=1 Tax=Colletotrichum noveboracense TaxID=2664923 RepID=A0A9W4WJW2_9PEZI|nr:unnamed protein product [Colletotrichum noveboracense]